ncbi:MAG: hypothetical protein A4E32_01229 [Methanomassiliicoccales archaeon PtaU1.Bin124]|nr:MAG: hypothetical protein A4E32_01229 [Methanomassiliicoccales archaeon PtaU1.Bin124]
MESDEPNKRSHGLGLFGGLIPDTVKGRVLAEIVADPSGAYTSSSMAKRIDRQPRYVNEALKELEEEGLVRPVGRKGRQAIYEICKGSNRLTALNLLMPAVGDDERNEKGMALAIFDYVEGLDHDIGYLNKTRPAELNKECTNFIASVTDENSWRLTKCGLY